MATHAGDCCLKRGAGAICIQLPDGGCVLVAKEQIAHVSAVPVEVVDTTVVGDAFAGAMAVAVLEQRSYSEAARFAVAGYEAQSAYLAREEVERMQQRLAMHIDARR